MKNKFYFGVIIIVLFACQSEKPKIQYENSTSVIVIEPEGDLFEPIKYVSTYESIDLAYPDSLRRVFRIDSNSVCKINYYYIKDSVYITQVRLGGIALPISDSINYFIYYGYEKFGINKKLPIHDISFKPNYSKIDSSAYIEFNRVENSELNKKVLNLVKEFELDYEHTSIALDEFKSTSK